MRTAPIRLFGLVVLGGCGQTVAARTVIVDADTEPTMFDVAPLHDAADACGPYFMRSTITEVGSPTTTICRTLAMSDFLVSWHRLFSSGMFYPCRVSSVGGGTWAVGLNVGVLLSSDFFGDAPRPGHPPVTVHVYSVTDTVSDASVYPTCAWVSERCDLTRLSSTDPAILIEARLASRCVLEYYPQRSRPGVRCADSITLESLQFRVRPGREHFIFSGRDASVPQEVPSCL